MASWVLAALLTLPGPGVECHDGPALSPHTTMKTFCAIVVLALVMSLACDVAGSVQIIVHEICHRIYALA